MNLKACFHKKTMQAIIYNEDDGKVVMHSGVNDARQAQIYCMTNEDTRRKLTEKLNVISVKVAWLPDGTKAKLTWPDETEEAKDKAEEPVKKKPAEKVVKVTDDLLFMDLPIQLSPQDFEDLAKRLINDLEDSDAAIESEKVRHKEEMTELNKQQLNIKLRLYDVRRGNMLTRVECEVQFDYAGGIKRIIRTDTGEVVEERDLTKAEMQLDAMEGLIPQQEPGEIVPIRVSNDSDTRFDTHDGTEWVETAAAKIKKGQRVRIFTGVDPFDIDGKTEFMAVTKAKKDKASGMIHLDVQAVK